MEDYFGELGTNKWAVMYDGINGKKRTEEEKKQFIGEKYNGAIRSIKIKQEIAIKEGNEERLRELRQKEEEVRFAYQQIKSMDLGNKLQDKLAKKEEGTIIQNIKSIEKNPYNVLGALKETIERLDTEEQKDAYIQKKRDERIRAYEIQLQGTGNDDFKTRIKIETKMKQIEEAYGKINTEEKRKEQEIESEYSHISEYDPNLIANKDEVGGQFLNNKLITRKESEDTEYLVPDMENRKLRILKIAEIIFQNSFGHSSHVNEYQITREINGQEKIDIIYTKLNLRYLQVKSIDPNCYNCVVNQLLAEDTIEGSKHNGGYIGEVKQDREGNYNITLKQEELSLKEQEQLTAVMIVEKMKEQEQERLGEIS